MFAKVFERLRLLCCGVGRYKGVRRSPVPQFLSSPQVARSSSSRLEYQSSRFALSVFFLQDEVFHSCRRHCARRWCLRVSWTAPISITLYAITMDIGPSLHHFSPSLIFKRPSLASFLYQSLRPLPSVSTISPTPRIQTNTPQPILRRPRIHALPKQHLRNPRRL